MMPGQRRDEMSGHMLYLCHQKLEMGGYLTRVQFSSCHYSLENVNTA